MHRFSLQNLLFLITVVYFDVILFNRNSALELVRFISFYSSSVSLSQCCLIRLKRNIFSRFKWIAEQNVDGFSESTT